MLPYMPDEGKLIHSAIAASARRPRLPRSRVTGREGHSPAGARSAAKRRRFSKAFATEEVDRFTFRLPGQAVSYFDGYTRLLQLRSDVEKPMGPKFNVQRFHDFNSGSQGSLPPDLLRKAVMSEFVSQGK